MDDLSTSSDQSTSLSVERIYSSRLLLTRCEELDLSFVVYCTNSEEANGRFLSTEPTNLVQVRQKFADHYYWNDDSKTYIIKSKADNKRLGIIRYWRNSAEPFTALYAVKIAIPDQRNLGYGTEAQAIFVKCLFDYFHFTCVEVHTDFDNDAQRRCLEKIGFRLKDTETYVDIDVQRTGRLYQMNRDEYQAIEQYREYNA